MLRAAAVWLVVVFSRVVLSSDYDWVGAWARMVAVMERSVERYSGVEAEKQLLALAEDVEHAVWIVKGEIYADERFGSNVLKSSKRLKQNLHLRMIFTLLEEEKTMASPLLASILREGRFGYSMTTAATGDDHCDAHNPRLVIAKKFGEDMCGLLVPNPYFGSLSEWGLEQTKFKDIADGLRWEDRDARVFWRGKIRGDRSKGAEKKSCERNAGNFARVSASALTLKFPQFFDVRSNSCVAQEPSLCDHAYNYTLLERRAIDTTTQRRKDDCPLIDGPFLAHEDFSNYRFLLDLPGSTTGSYSRNLNHLWLFGAVVLLWDGPLLHKGGAMQWYSPALQENATHLVVNRDTAYDTVAAVRSRNKPRSLIANARGVADHLLCPRCQATYFMRLFQKLLDTIPSFYRDLLNDDRHLQRRQAILRQANCHTINLVKVVAPRPFGSTKTHHLLGQRPSDVQTLRANISACDLLSAPIEPSTTLHTLLLQRRPKVEGPLLATRNNNNTT